ncbi:right-handed parallel beta-helix repeat-containing protein [Nanoarchaeota archaeon]
MRNKKGDLAVAAVLAAVIIVVIGVFLFVDLEPGITGFAVAGQSFPGGTGNITHCDYQLSGQSVLVQNISTPNSTCFTMSNNAVLDCQGYTITGPGSTGTAIKSYGASPTPRNNFTIKNCQFDNWGYGVSVIGTNISIINNTFGKSDLSGGSGLSLISSSNILAENNTFYHNGTSTPTFAISISNSTYSNFTNNYITGYVSGISDSQSYNSTNLYIANNQIINMSQVGIILSYTRDSTVLNNTIINASIRGIWLNGWCHNTQLINNNITLLTSYGFGVGLSENVSLINNSEDGTSNIYGYEITRTNNTLFENNFCNTSHSNHIRTSGNINISFYDIENSNCPFALSSASGNSYNILIGERNVTELLYPNISNAGGSVRFPDLFQFDPDQIFVNVSAMASFNKNATLTFYNQNFSSLNDSKIYADYGDNGTYIECPNSTCNKISYSSGTLVVNVSHFTTYGTTNTTFNTSSLSSCVNITTPGAYSLNQNITANLSDNSTCFSILSDNITIDCQGYALTGNGSGFAIYTGGMDNITIKNCIFTSFQNGIYLAAGSDHVIRDNQFYNNGLVLPFGGVYSHSAKNVQIINNTANNNKHGIHIYSGSDYRIINNTANNNTATGIYLIATNNTIINNIANSNKVRGFLIDDYSDNNTLLNNTATSNDLYGFQFELSTTNNLLANCSASSSGTADIRIHSSEVDIVDSVLGSYEFVSANNLSLENTAFGQLEFLANIAESGSNLFGSPTSDIRIDNNSIFVNSSSQPGFNISANLTHYSLQSSQNQPLWDPEDDGLFVQCPGSVCTNVSFDNGTNELNYLVNHFTTYQAGASLSSCNNISAPGTYTLTQNISSNGTCFNILADNVIFDCAGYTITGNGTAASSGYGIYVPTQENITIQNCDITTFYYAAYLFKLRNGVLLNNQFRNSFNGAYFWPGTTYSGTGQTIRNNTFSSNSNAGLTVSQMSGHLIENNTFQGSGSSELYLGYTSNVTVRNNTFWGSSNTWASVRMSSSVVDIWITNNTVDCGKYCISAQSSSGITIEDNAFTKRSNPIQTVSAIIYYGVNHTIVKDCTFSGSYPANYYRDIYYDNTFNSSIVDLVIGRYSLINADLLSLEDTTNGKLSFTAQVNENATTSNTASLFDSSSSDIQINNNSVYVNSSQNGLNVSANITLYNINLTDPEPYVDLNDDTQFEPCTFCNEISYNNSTLVYIFNTTHFTTLKADIDTVPPISLINSPANNSDIGQNNFPINISGTASDDVGLSYIEVSINGTFYNTTGTSNWNYSWTPSSDGEYPIYSRAVDTSNNLETQFETYYVEVYTTSNLTNATKINSINLNSNIFDSIEIDSTIDNVSNINISTFLNVTSSNCDITNSELNHSRCYDSIIINSNGEGWYVDPSNITNVTGSNNNWTNSNISDSYVDDSNVSDSEVRNSNITSTAIVNGSHIFDSNISDSYVDFSTINNSDINNSDIDNSNIFDSDVYDSNVTDSNVTDSTIDDSVIDDSTIDNSTIEQGSNITNSNVTDSTVTNSNVTDSNITNSDIDDSTIEDSEITDSTVDDSTITNSTINNSDVTGSTLNNVTIVNSTVIDAVLNNTNITNDLCYSGTIVYQGTTYTCSVSNPIDLDTIYNPPLPLPPSTSGGGGGGSSACQQRWECTDWEACQPDGMQYRTCTDLSRCEEKNVRLIYGTKPAENQTCTYISTCSDNSQNQDETDVDCGGTVCSPCDQDKTCQQDSDCQTSHCFKNTCLPAEADCLDNSDCPEDHYCQSNVCTLIDLERLPLTIEVTLWEHVYQLAKNTIPVVGDYVSEYLDVMKQIQVDALSIAKVAFNQAYESSLGLTKKIAEAVPFLQANVVSTIIFLLIIGAVLATYVAFKSYVHSTARQTKKKQIIKKQRKKSAEGYSQLLSEFIKNSFLHGFTAKHIKDALVHKGWPKKIVDNYVDQAAKEHRKVTKEAKKTQEKMLLEKQQTQITEEVSHIGVWKTMQRIIRPKSKAPSFSVEIDRARELKDFIDASLNKGYSRRPLEKMLISQGWPIDIVDQYLNSQIQKFKKLRVFKQELKNLEQKLGGLRKWK